MTVSIDTPPPTTGNSTASSARSTPNANDNDTVKCELTPPSTPGQHDCSTIEKEHLLRSPFAKYITNHHTSIYELQEAIASTLSNSSPELLASFVDPVVSSFKAIFESDRQLVIWRKGNALFIGIFENHTSMKAFRFDHLVGVAIGWDGSWHILGGAGNAFCDPKWGDVWAGKYRCLGGVNKMVVEYESMGTEKMQRVSMLAEDVLGGKFWAAKVEAKIT